MKFTVEIDIDEKKYVQVCKVEDIQPLGEAVTALYGKIWVEACYDPYNEETKKIAREMFPYIQKINDILQIKK